MEAGTHALALLLTLAALTAGTIEYAEVVRRRTALRTVTVDGATLREAGLPAMVRVLVVNEAT